MSGHKIDVQGLGLAFGLVAGIFSMLMGWLAISGWGTEFVQVVSTFYVGYEPTLFGGVIGGIWGFIDGMIMGSLIAWFYNKITGAK